MRIQIVDNPVVCGGSADAHSYRKRLQALAGQWIDVETDHVFDDQFNCPPESDEYECGLRVHIRHVQNIEDDVRPGAIKCLYCGFQLLDTAEEDVLRDCPKCEYKAGEGHIQYTNNELCVMDRLRPLLTVEDGKVSVIYNKRRRVKVTTPQGDVIWRMGPPMRVTARTNAAAARQ